MQEHFYASLAKKDLVIFMKRVNHPGTFRFVIMLALFTCSAYAVVHTWDRAFWQVVLSQLFFGIMCCSIFACLHETGHGTAFKTKQANRIAAFICGILHVYPSVAFRELHFTHHRYTHIPGKDPEISLGNQPMPTVISSLPTYFAWLTGLPLLLFKVMMIVISVLGMPEFIRSKLYPFIRPKVRFKLWLDSLVVFGLYGGIIWAAISVNSNLWALIVGQVVGHSLLASYLAMEHNGLPHEGDILDRTRSIKTGPLVRLLMWNMPYHAEHHAYPAVPFHALPALHLIMQKDLKHQSLDHPHFHSAVLRRDLELLKNS